MATERPIKIFIVIPVHNRKKDVMNCLNQLRMLNKGCMDITIVVVDDGSTDGTSEIISSRYPEVILLHGDGNLWWTGATKVGVNYALSEGCDYVLILNDDVCFQSDFLLEMVKTAKSYLNAIICGVICDVDDKNKIISAGRYVKGFLNYNYFSYLKGLDISVLPKKEYESYAESGYAMLVPRAVLEKLNFDEKRFPHHMGDMDFVLRAKRSGFKIIVNPDAFLYTKIGDNYFHNCIVDKPLWYNLKMFFNIKSTVNLRTRWFFYWYHTPYFLGWLSFIYFIGRMCVAIAMKVILPNKTLNKIMNKRTIALKVQGQG